jgi:prepilin peptidase CpaA
MSTTAIIMLVTLVSVAALYDLRFRKIPNWLNVGGLVFAIAFACLEGGFEGLKTAGFGALCALAIYAPLYLLRGMGAGDVKLMAAVGALCGPGNWIVLFLLTALLGGVASVGLILYRRSGWETLRNVATIVGELIHGRAPANAFPNLDIRNDKALRMPHGVVIAVGSLVFCASLGWRR